MSSSRVLLWARVGQCTSALVAMAGTSQGGLAGNRLLQRRAHGPLPDVHTVLPCACVCLQVYAASIMFGYFLRRVDKRFQLESALGMIDMPGDTEEAVARLERLFAQVGWVGPGFGPGGKGWHWQAECCGGRQGSTARVCVCVQM